MNRRWFLRLFGAALPAALLPAKLEGLTVGHTAPVPLAPKGPLGLGVRFIREFKVTSVVVSRFDAFYGMSGFGAMNEPLRRQFYEGALSEQLGLTWTPPEFADRIVVKEGARARRRRKRVNANYGARLRQVVNRIDHSDGWAKGDSIQLKVGDIVTFEGVGT